MLLRPCRCGIGPRSAVVVVAVLFTKLLRKVLLSGPGVRLVRTASSILTQRFPENRKSLLGK